jgi:hypothetical protein
MRDSVHSVLFRAHIRCKPPPRQYPCARYSVANWFHLEMLLKKENILASLISTWHERTTAATTSHA